MERKYNSGINYERAFSVEGKSPFEVSAYDGKLDWKSRTAVITDDDNRVIFKQENFEAPSFWSENAVNTVASKYAHGDQKKGERESSVKQIIKRVGSTIAQNGLAQGYFVDETDAERFSDDLQVGTATQYWSFNSPVWFNVGLRESYLERTGRELQTGARKGHYYYDLEERVAKPLEAGDNYKHPQASACFIQSVDDSMEDIARLTTDEMMLFKYGSGTGTDLSTLRSSRESLSEGGTPSGPISFMRVWDQVAAVVKSGGKTRRAAKMQSLKDIHPDISEFIEMKSREEKKAWALMDAGYDGSFNGEAYSSVMFQNSNLSVRLSDEFMQAVIEDKPWTTRLVTDPSKDGPTYRARDLFRKIAEGTHLCGDPGIQYDTTINKWHTCANDGRINASNPCSEYMFLDNSACNLASLNLMKFVDLEKRSFDVEKFQKAVRTVILAQDILVDSASYPNPEITQNSHKYRPVGLGYANLGAVMMALGMPYDSDSGRAFASSVTALMTNTAYNFSKELAKKKGAFERYEQNKDPMNQVLKMHQQSTENITESLLPESLREVTRVAKKEGLEMILDNESGYRNAQVTVLAPTGTIGFMMDCDTTGVEPDVALVKYKDLAGGGNMKIVNKTVGPALSAQGYDSEMVKLILDYLDKNETVEGAPGLKEEHLPIFDCSFVPAKGKRHLSYQAHLKMMAAVQPFLSGAISKTINMPGKSTVEDVEQAYIEGWKLGLKAVAIYRDGSKRFQPLNISKGKSSSDENVKFYVREGSEPGLRPVNVGDESKLIKMLEQKGMVLPPQRRRLPQTDFSIRHKFIICDAPTGTRGEKLHDDSSELQHETYLHLGFFDDGKLGEIFYTSGKEGGTVGGLLDAFGTSLSLLLQYNVPLTDLINKFENSSFPPSGMVIHPAQQGTLDKLLAPDNVTRVSKSIIDYTMKYLKETCTIKEPERERKDAPYLAFRKGLMNNSVSVVQTETKTDLDSSDFMKMPRDDLFKLADRKCTGTICGCGGPAITMGKCGWFCIGRGRKIEGTCSEG
jgi:ribonucleoside-diphosphate reductase alpha chain